MNPQVRSRTGNDRWRDKSAGTWHEDRGVRLHWQYFGITAVYGAKAGVPAVVLLPSGKVALGKLAQALMHGAKVY